MNNNLKTGLIPSIAALVLAASALLGAGASAARAGGSFAGDLLVDDFNGHDILAFSPTDGSYRGVFAAMPGGAGPSYMAQGPNGNIYVGSYFSGSAVEFDGRTGAQIASFSLQPPTANAIITGIAFDAAGNLFAADSKVTNDGTIDEYDATTGAFERQVASGLATPRGLVVDGGNLYVTVGSSSVGAIAEFSESGTPLGSFGQSQFGVRPEGLVVGPNGNLFATDGDSSVYQFTPDGSPVGAGPFAASGQIISTYGAGFGPDGSLYVVDDTGPVYKFDPDGNLVGSGPFIDQVGTGYDLQYPVSALYDAAAVPEPRSILLVLAGLSIVAVRRRRPSGEPREIRAGR